ncbi:MAG: YihY/virulence factor BrkB family protein [Clostridiales bacterium]|nr:YihY/virulence factor BrkB family protein [Clostridiales bacterium]
MKYLKNKIESILSKIKENRAGSFLFSLIKEIKNDRLSELAANMAYYLLLALFPFLIFLLGVFSYTPISIANVSEALSSILPKETADVILGTVREVLNNNNTALFSFAMLGTIWISTKGARALIKGVNRAYGVTETRSLLVTSGINIFVIISIPFFAIMSFLLIVIGKLLVDQVAVWFNLPVDVQSIMTLLRYVIPIVMLVFYFAIFYKFVPNLRLSFRKIFVGAIFTTFGWITTSMLFSFYINNFANYTRVYGSLGSIIGLLLWINMSSMIILIGAEINMLVKGHDKVSLQEESNIE